MAREAIIQYLRPSFQFIPNIFMMKQSNTMQSIITAVPVTPKNAVSYIKFLFASPDNAKGINVTNILLIIYSSVNLMATDILPPIILPSNI